MINLNDCIELGILLKPHGIKGQLILKLNEISFDEIQTMESVFIIFNALPVPFFIVDFSQKNFDSVVLNLEDVATEAKARELINKKVFIEKRFLSAPNSVQINPSYSGYKVIDSNAGYIGVLNEILDFNKNPILQILQNKIEILLPLNQEFILDIDEIEKEIHVCCPDGLLDLYI